MMVSRSFFTRFAQQRQLQSLEKDAQQYPRDAAKQAEYLKKLNSHDPEAVLRRVESQVECVPIPLYTCPQTTI